MKHFDVFTVENTILLHLQPNTILELLMTNPLLQYLQIYIDQFRENIQKMEMSLDYIEAYHNYGKDILISPLHKQLIPKIVSLLPSNYRALDVGSDNCVFADEVTKEAETVGKKGEIVVIDPFPTDERVIKTTGQQYVCLPHEKKFDLIIMEEVIHLIPNIGEFFKACHNLLNDDGHIITYNMTKESTFPWTQLIQLGFQKSCFDQTNLQTAEGLFEIKIEREIQEKQVDAKIMLGLIKYRGWSNLLNHSEAQIEEGVKVVLSQGKDTVPVTIGAAMILLKKIK